MCWRVFRANVVVSGAEEEIAFSDRVWKNNQFRGKGVGQEDGVSHFFLHRGGEHTREDYPQWKIDDAFHTTGASYFVNMIPGVQF